MPNGQHYEIVSTHKSLTRKMQHHKNLLERFTKQWRNEYLQSLREQSIPKSKTNREPVIAVGDIVIVRDDKTNRNFWKLARVEQLLIGDDGTARAAIVRVCRKNSNHSQLLRRSIQHLIPIEVRQTSENDETTNVERNETEEQVLQLSSRPQRNAAISGQLRRLKQMGVL